MRLVRQSFIMLHEQGVFRLAKHVRLVMLRRLHQYLWDNRYEKHESVSTGGYCNADQLKPVDATNHVSGLSYLPTPRLVVKWILNGLNTDLSRFVFVDFGSGRGRVLLAAAEKPLNRVIGVEFCEILDGEAKQNISKYPAHLLACEKVESHCMDAVNFKLPDNDCILYFFNPFDAVIVDTVVRNAIRDSKKNNNRLIVVYFNPVFPNAVSRHEELQPLSLTMPQRLWLKLLGPYPVLVHELGR